MNQLVSLVKLHGCSILSLFAPLDYFLFELFAFILFENHTHIFVFFEFFFDALLHVIIKRWPYRLVHPVIPTLLVDHTFVECFLLIYAVATALPVRGISHFDKTAVVKCTSNVLAGIHCHVLDTERLCCRVSSPFRWILQTFVVEVFGMLARCYWSGIFVGLFQKSVLLVWCLRKTSLVLLPKLFCHLLL